MERYVDCSEIHGRGNVAATARSIGLGVACLALAACGPVPLAQSIHVPLAPPPRPVSELVE
jgi:hypothetical protein